MTIIKHELKQNLKSFLIWTLSITFLMAICVFMFPQMKDEMESVTDMFASMGAFTSAFGMDKLNFGSLVGFYAIECGNILGIGGAFFASLIAISALAKEEKEHTAEFLLTHPQTRRTIVTQKLIAVIVQIVAMNLIICLVSILSIVAVGEAIPWKEFILLHLSYLFMQLQVGSICFGISAFIRRGGLGIGLGLTAVFYFLNIIANIAEVAKFLKYVTPFGYTDGADIVSNGSLNIAMLLIGLCVSVGAILLGYWHYCKKDIR